MKTDATFLLASKDEECIRKSTCFLRSGSIVREIYVHLKKKIKKWWTQSTIFVSEGSELHNAYEEVTLLLLVKLAWWYPNGSFGTSSFLQKKKEKKPVQD